MPERWGRPDVETRWWGRTRAAWLLALVGTLAGMAGILSHHLWLLGGVALAIMLVTFDNDDLLQWFARAVRYLGRSRVTWLSITSADRHKIAARQSRDSLLTSRRVIGRLDLTTDPRAFTREWSRALCRAALVRGGEWSLHGSTPDAPLWSASSSGRLPGFTPSQLDVSSAWVREQWTHVRVANEVSRVLTVRDLTKAGPEWMSRLLTSDRRHYLVHCRYQQTELARRRAERDAHAAEVRTSWRAALGWRPTAGTSSALVRARRRESDVVAQGLLARVTIRLSVTAPSTAQLTREVAALRREARVCGVRLRGGAGEQLAWYCSMIPGGPCA